MKQNKKKNPSHILWALLPRNLQFLRRQGDRLAGGDAMDRQRLVGQIQEFREKIGKIHLDVVVVFARRGCRGRGGRRGVGGENLRRKLNIKMRKAYVNNANNEKIINNKNDN